MRYDYSLLVLVDKGIAAGGGLGMSGEGAIFFYPTEEKALAFTRELLAEGIQQLTQQGKSLLSTHKRVKL